MADPTSDSPAGSDGRSTWTWLLPALAFVAGVALGAVVVAVGASGDDDDTVPGVTASSSPEASATPDGAGNVTATPSGDALVRVPASCLDAADGAERAARQVDDVAAAVREFDARRLQELVDEFQQLQPEVQRLADQCRSAAGEGLGDGTLVTPAPAASAS